jgi:predicted TIM-barrel fold metal-dependent hydrolase
MTGAAPESAVHGAAADVPVIDTHHHMWDSRSGHPAWLSVPPSPSAFQGDMTPIWKSYLIEDYLRDIAGQNVRSSVYIECGWGGEQALAEARWVQSIADRHGYPHGIVAYAELDSPGLRQHLEALAGIANVRGIRQTMNWDADPRFRVAARADLMDDPRWRRGLRLLADFGLHFELSVYPRQMAIAARVVREHENVFVLSHTGMPLRKDAEELSAWRTGLRALAASEHVVCKLSGLGMFDHQWTAESIRPFMLEALGIFGPARCMWGSNFPVDRLYSGYDRLLDAARVITKDLTAQERVQLFHDTAQRIYRLGAGRLGAGRLGAGRPDADVAAASGEPG